MVARKIVNEKSRARWIARPAKRIIKNKAWNASASVLKSSAVTHNVAAISGGELR